ncbi:MAG TPA: hypothetical protein VGU43_02130, partial [Thermoplasmata archaeon]|nr:hypothetical protein [Thermoplasmata archaeon]
KENPVGLTRSPPAAANATRTLPAPAAAARAGPAAAPPASGGSLLRLDVPFDPDEFARQLGESRIQVDVPRDALAEVLRRVADFMGFGIYVYEIRIAPAPGEQLQSFRVELTRVDYSARDKRWGPFEERGRSDSPFGPGSTGERRT